MILKPVLQPARMAETYCLVMKPTTPQKERREKDRRARRSLVWIGQMALELRVESYGRPDAPPIILTNGWGRE
jgi:hypothetical protein